MGAGFNMGGWCPRCFPLQPSLIKLLNLLKMSKVILHKCLEVVFHFFSHVCSLLQPTAVDSRKAIGIGENEQEVTRDKGP